jgi:multidrug efflux system membrane fusion protein
MKRTRFVLCAVLLALVIGFYAYPRITASAPAAAAAPATSGTEDGKRGRSGGGSAPVAVVTAVATAEDVPVTRTAVGWVEPVATVALRPRIDGVVIGRSVTDGQIVKAGDVLFRLDDAGLQATVAKDQAALAKDQANLDQANADLKRDQSLVGRNDVVTRQQVEQQAALVKELEATIGIDKAQLQADQVQVGYATISAPIGGRVGVVATTNGNLVHSSDQTPLLTITEMAPLRISYMVPERDLDAYRSALAPADPVPVKAIDPASGAERAEGRLTFIDSSVDTTSGTVTLKAEFANADGALWPGEYVRLETTLGVQKSVTVVPATAIQQNDKGAFVFLAKSDRTVVSQPVTLADSKGGNAVITSGLKPGDHVVVEGQLRLSNGSPVKEVVASADAGKPTTATR